MSTFALIFYAADGTQISRTVFQADDLADALNTALHAVVRAAAASMQIVRDWNDPLSAQERDDLRKQHGAAKVDREQVAT